MSFIITDNQIDLSSTNQIQADLLKRLKIFLDAQEADLDATKVTLADTDVRLAAKTGISPAQASAITANTAKTGISSGQSSAITANTAKTGITSTESTNIATNNFKVSFVGGTSTALSFGEMIVTGNGKGNPDTYSIVMTAVMGALTKTVTLVLV
tara:strand:+ start:72 stop:536 length:465 start_codon:yes stop_codon:yes gene_type:complete